jgi:hypothetical protein
MKIKNTVMTSSAACIFWAGSLSLAQAEFTLIPSITVREEYNDNIDLTPSNKVDDFISTVTPAIAVSYKLNILTLLLDYGLDFRFYAKHPDRNETSPTQTQRAKLETTFSPYRDMVFIKVSDVYERVPIDQRKQVALDNIAVNMTDSNRFLVNPYLEYPLSASLKAKVGYSYENIWYRSDESVSAENHTATAMLSKVISQNLSASLSYSYLFHRPSTTKTSAGQVPDDQAYDNQNVTLGIGYQVSPKLSLNGSIGETFYDYVNNESLNSSSPIWQIQATYLLTEKITLGAGYSQSYSNSLGKGYSQSYSNPVDQGANNNKLPIGNINYSDQGTYKNRSVTGSISYSGKIPVSISVIENDETYLTGNREDRSIGGTIQSSLPITANIMANLTGTYTNYKFLPDNDRVNRYGAMIDFGYTLRKIKISCGYVWNQNDSSINAHDYMNNIVFVQAKYTF